MKPIHTLTWAVSAPILLFAGASQAVVNVSDLTDPSCAGTFVYDSASDKISCQASAPPTVVPSCTVSAPSSVSVGGIATISASCSQSPTSYAWTTSTDAPAISGTGGALNFPNAGTFTYQVKASNSVGTGPDSTPENHHGRRGGRGGIGGHLPQRAGHHHHQDGWQGQSLQNRIQPGVRCPGQQDRFEV